MGMLQQIARAAGTMIALPDPPADGAREYNAMEQVCSLVLLLLRHVRCGNPGWEEGSGTSVPEQHHPARICAPDVRSPFSRVADPVSAPGRARLVPGGSLVIAGSGLGLLVSQLKIETPSGAIGEEQVERSCRG